MLYNLPHKARLPTVRLPGESTMQLRIAQLTGLVATLAACCLLASPAVAQGLGDLYRVRDGVSDTHMEYHEVQLPPGKEVVLGDLKGPGKITYWYITDSSGGKFYAGLVLKVFWDNEADPSINVPLADFFGAMGGHTIDYQSAPLAIEHFCYMCHLPMPFSQRARLVLANDGDKEYRQSVAWGIDYEQNPQFAEEKSRLCCAWRRSNPVRDGLHTILDVRGRGHYVGNFLQVETRFSGWWGEGDTIFHRDGKKITHSPGTEDEYGTAGISATHFRILTAAICSTTRAGTACTAGTFPIPCGSGNRCTSRSRTSTTTAPPPPPMPTTTPVSPIGTRTTTGMPWLCKRTPSAWRRARQAWERGSRRKEHPDPARLVRAGERD